MSKNNNQNNSNSPFKSKEDEEFFKIFIDEKAFLEYARKEVDKMLFPKEKKDKK